MGEWEEFAEALLGQLSVELNEEREITDAAARAADAMKGISFPGLEEVAKGALGDMEDAVRSLGAGIPDGISLQFPGLADLKKLKGTKVSPAPGSGGFVTDLFGAVAGEDVAKIAGLMRDDTPRYLVYSTYAIQYVSKITTTYGDYMGGTIHLNGFVLPRYPKIILYKRGEPYGDGLDAILSGYAGAVKMTLVEGLAHAALGPLYDSGREAAARMNEVGEELAAAVMSLDAGAVDGLADHCKLQPVPDDFPMAKRANLYFFLSPDHFLTGQMGPESMTYTNIKLDPGIGKVVPGLQGMYERWLVPRQKHHASLAAMEGMASLAVEEALKSDRDFASYLGVFMGTDAASYLAGPGAGKKFAREVYGGLGGDAFAAVCRSPPDARDLADPGRYLARLGA